MENFLVRVHEWIDTPGWLERAKTELRGQALGWCRGAEPCHGEVLARLVDGERYDSIRDDVLQRLHHQEERAQIDRQRGLFERVA